MERIKQEYLDKFISGQFKKIKVSEIKPQDYNFYKVKGFSHIFESVVPVKKLKTTKKTKSTKKSK